jgi:hypothetical protein
MGVCAMVSTICFSLLQKVFRRFLKFMQAMGTAKIVILRMILIVVLTILVHVHSANGIRVVDRVMMIMLACRIHCDIPIARFVIWVR